MSKPTHRKFTGEQTCTLISPLVLLFFLSSLVEPDTIGTMVSGSFLFTSLAASNQLSFHFAQSALNRVVAQ